MSNPNEPLPDFSDVLSGSSSEGMTREKAVVATYTVEKGDTLSHIARLKGWPVGTYSVEVWLHGTSGARESLRRAGGSYICT